MDNRTALAVLAAAATGVQVGAAITATRFVATDISPTALAFLRYAIGVACLVPPLLLAPRMRFARADILPIAALGIGQFGVLIALLNYGLQTVPAGRGALILSPFRCSRSSSPHCSATNASRLPSSPAFS